MNSHLYYHKLITLVISKWSIHKFKNAKKDTAPCIQIIYRVWNTFCTLHLQDILQVVIHAIGNLSESRDPLLLYHVIFRNAPREQVMFLLRTSHFRHIGEIIVASYTRIHWYSHLWACVLKLRIVMVSVPISQYVLISS